MSPNTMEKSVCCVPEKKNGRFTKIRKNLLKVTTTFLLAFNFLFGAYCPVFAAGDAEKIIKDLLGDLINILCMAFSAVGILMVAFSIPKAIMSFRNEDTDGQTRAAMAIILGVFLTASGLIVNGFGLIDLLYTF